MIYANVVCKKDRLKQDIVLEFCRKQNKEINILTETHITDDQIHQIRNNWLGLIFLSHRNIYTNGLLAQNHPGLDKVSLTLIQKGDLRPSSLLSLITEFSVIVPL